MIPVPFYDLKMEKSGGWRIGALASRMIWDKKQISTEDF